jgi:nitroreductase
MIDGFARNLSPEAQLQWNQRQVYIALGNLMTTAAMLGIDTCPIEGFNPDAVDELMGLPALGYRASVLCAVGFRSAADKHATLAKVRYSPAKVIEHID